ncbi:MAG: CheR family methyltransferase [Desulfuromonadales bacterium]
MTRIRQPLGREVGISDEGFLRFSRLITEKCGIRMPPQKKTMLETRLRKRLRSLGIETFEQYGKFVFSPQGMREELTHLIDVITTNKTDFFREADHFDFLLGQALPHLVEDFGAGLQRPLQVWSAGCSTGEEPYTLAMVLAEFAARCPGFTYEILATDISTRVLETARLGIYSKEKFAGVPTDIQRKYLLRSRDREDPRMRIVPELRATVSFRHLNFMDADYEVRKQIDVIFCRNVLIYFDRLTQEAILRRLTDHLSPSRYLFTGHAETLGGMDLPVVHIAPSVYRRI